MKFLAINILIGFLSLLLASESSGFIKKLNGKVSVLRDSKVIELKIGDKVFEKDIVKTQNKSSIGIIFNDNTLVSLGPNTDFIIEEYIFKPAENKQSFISRLSKGTLTCLTGLMSKLNPEAMKIKAKTASIGIRGTHFAISVD
ncbi:FecR domain-containing protein [Arcobacter sp. LA11]|uniref:FecR family protein n=1 Tax=Arcobacter sp. LA11 TaxID=1898176 RepID=UPI0009350CAF|nr:FecR domain-containing protein [Arcobacter sp. LA11]